MGFQTTGTASEYFAVDASKVHYPEICPMKRSYDRTSAVAVHGVKRWAMWLA